MKLKSCCLFFAVLLFFVVPGSLFAQQSDFYGTWTTRISEDSEHIIVRFIISASDITILFELYEDNELLDTERIDAKIIKWAVLDNDDSATRVSYPSGYSITVSMDEAVEAPLEIFISKDKRQLVIPELNDGLDEIQVFRKL